jgi:hypothetical protein
MIHHGFCKLGISLISQRHFSTHGTLPPSLNFERFCFSDTLGSSRNLGFSPSLLIIHFLLTTLVFSFLYNHCVFISKASRQAKER